MSNGSEPNLSSRGGNPSLAASSGFELDESDEVDVQPLPFRWIPVLFRPGGVEAVAAVNFGVESWEEKKGQCGSAGPERKGRRDSGGRRSWEKRRELVREKNASSAHRERGGGGGVEEERRKQRRKRTFGLRERIPADQSFASSGSAHRTRPCRGRTGRLPSTPCGRDLRKERQSQQTENHQKRWRKQSPNRRSSSRRP